MTGASAEAELQHNGAIVLPRFRDCATVAAMLTSELRISCCHGFATQAAPRSRNIGVDLCALFAELVVVEGRNKPCSPARCAEELLCGAWLARAQVAQEPSARVRFPRLADLLVELCVGKSFVHPSQKMSGEMLPRARGHFGHMRCCPRATAFQALARPDAGLAKALSG